MFRADTGCEKLRIQDRQHRELWRFISPFVQILLQIFFVNDYKIEILGKLCTRPQEKFKNIIIMKSCRSYDGECSLPPCLICEAKKMTVDNLRGS